MSEEEQIDIFDENMVWVGTAPRAEAHAKGNWHQTFHCWLIRRDQHGRYVLFQRRGPDKKLFPNMLDITAAGHLLTGETTADGIREVNEELGLSATMDDVVPLGIKHDVAKVGDVVNREFAHVFLLPSDLPLEDYNLQPDEVTGIIQIEINDGLRLLSGEVSQVRGVGYQVDADGLKHQVEIPVSVSDIIPRIDNYYFKIFIMAERFFDGNRYLSI